MKINLIKKQTIILNSILFVLIILLATLCYINFDQWNKYKSTNPILNCKRFFHRPKVSVILPSYNMADTLPNAIDSIINQTYHNWEILVINDGSQDNTRQVLKKYENNYKIRIIHNPQNLGLIRTLNNGIDAAKGKYLARLDADDTSLPDRLERQVTLMERENLDMLSQTHYYESTTDNEKEDIFDTYTSGVKLFKSVHFSHSSTMLKKSFLTKNNLKYDIKYPNAEDYDLWLAIFFAGGKIGDMGGQPVSVYKPSYHSTEYFKKQFFSTAYIRIYYLSKLIPHFDGKKLLPLSLCELLPHVIEGNAITQVLDNEQIKKYYNNNCLTPISTPKD